MKRIDFTKPGGFPLTQNQLAYLQQAYAECLAGLAEMGGVTGGPFIISGCAFTRVLSAGTVYSWSVAAGWVYYGSEMVRVNASGPVLIDESVNKPFISIAAVDSALTFNDGSTPTVRLDKEGTIDSQPIATADTSVLFAVSSLKRFGREDAETHIVVATGAGAGTLSGDIYYRKNFLNNTLQIRGFVLVGTPGDFLTLPSLSVAVMATLPVGYRPPSMANFVAYVTLVKLDASSTDYLRSINCIVDGNGNVIAHVADTVAHGGYILNWNQIIPLD